LKRQELGKDVEKTDVYTVGGKIGATILENNTEVPKEIKNRTPYDPTSPLLDIQPKGNEVTTL
jgi:hypothetical protein